MVKKRREGVPAFLPKGTEKARNQKLNPGLPQEEKGLHELSHHLWPPRVFVSMKLESFAEPRLKGTRSDMKGRYCTSMLTSVPNTHL